MTASSTIDEIERVRRQNNKVWMNLVRLAVRTEPSEVKKLLKQIEENDRRVSDLCKSLQEQLPD